MINKNLNFICKILCCSVFFLITNCDPDETQKVANFNNIILAQEFDTDGAPDPSIWDYDLGNGSEQGLVGCGNCECH